MKKKKLIAALMLCCIAVLPAKADDVIIDQGISNATNGALNNGSGDKMTIRNGLTFANNKGDTSGGIYNLGELIIEDGTKDNHTTFSGNSVTSPWGGGGAIYSYAAGSSIDIGDFTSFENNTTANVSNGNSGGAIYVGDAILNIGDNVNFSGNAAATSGFGGALYIQNTTTTIGDSFNVSGNSAKFGGGIAINNNKGETASIGNNSTFSGNSASNGNGGAISSESTNFTIGSGATFENNTASANGGAIAVSQFGGEAGKVTIGEGAKFINNIAQNGNGGAIYNTTNIEIQGGTFTGNSATVGGAIYNATGGSMSLANVTFNAADSNGSNSIYSDGSVVTSSTGNNINTFNSDITINDNWEFGGNNTVGGNIDGTGAITNTGNTTLAGNNSGFTGTFSQDTQGATTTVSGTFFGGQSTVSDGTLNWETGSKIPQGGSLAVSGGTLNIGNSSGNTGTLTLDSGSSVANAVITNINQGSTLDINGGSAALDNGDNWIGSVSLNGGNLSVSGITTGALDAISGSLTLDNVTLGNNTTISENIQLNVSNGLTNNAVLTNNTGMNVDGTFTNNSGAEVTGDGNLTITSGSNAGSIAQETVTINNGGNFSNTGNIEADTITNNGTLVNDGTGALVAETITNEAGATFTNNTDNVQAGTFNNAGNVNGTGSLNLGSGSNSGSITQDSITIASGGTYNNDTGASINVGNLTIDGTLNNFGSIGSQGSIVENIINNGTFNNQGSGSIYADKIENKEGATFTTTNENVVANEFINNGTYHGAGTTEAETGNNTSTIIDNNVVITGEYSNSGTIQAESSFQNSGTITDSNPATNNSSISTVDGSNSGSITQDSMTITGNFDNTGSINVNEFNNSGTITDSNSAIDNSSITINNTGINTGSITQDTINIAAGGVLTSGDGTNQASITVGNLANAGTITLNNSVLNVTNEVNGGIINAINSGNELNAIISDGTLNIGNNDTIGTLTQTGGSISADAIINVTSGSTYDINQGSVILDKATGSADTWNGAIKITGGELTTDGFTGGNGALEASSGTLNITNSSNITVGQNSSIADAVNTTIDSSSILNINNGGNVVLNSGDDWSGTIVLGTAGATNDSSSLDVSGLTSTGALQANSGNLTVGSNNLDITTGSYIENEVAIQTSGNINITGTGVVGVDDNDTLASTSIITLTDEGTLNYGNTQDPDFIINATSGNLNLLDGSKLTIGGTSTIADAVALDIQKGATLTLDSAVLNLDNADQWDGKIINQAGGTINANGLINNSETASLEQNSGVLNIYNDAQLTLGEGSFIKDGEINITKGPDGENGSTFTLANGTIEGGDMTIDKDSAFIVKEGTFSLDKISGSGEFDPNGVMQAALVNTANGDRVQHTITELAINGQTNFNIDIHARGNHYTSNDQFIVTNLTGDGVARVDDWSLNGDILGWDAPIDRHIVLDHIFVDQDGNPLQGNIEVTDKTQFTPIGWYQLNQKGSGAGLHYTLDLVKYNPEVYRGQVTTVAQWMNQLAIDDMLFTHSMVLPSFKEEDGGVAYSGIMANRYAASNPLFAPYQYSRKDGGLWYKMYGTFENLNMNLSGLGRVGNNAYGALIGADFGLKELKNGWKFMPTAYIGYNGAHQAYPGVGAYQNGGQAGFLGTWYKNNFIIGGLVYGGVYENSMDVAGHTDNAFNYFAGAATKLAYNWRFHRDWVLQPNLMAAYNFFGQQNWHSDYGQMGMMAGMLHGANIAPGVNLIWEKETFSIYGTLQYMYNINGAVGGQAGNVGLPQVEMERGYIQYGLGFTKKWGDRFSGYLQAVLRNVGRTGVGFQMGFNILLGK